MALHADHEDRKKGLFAYFERRIDPFPKEEPQRPPARLLPFLLHYSRPMLPWLALMSVLTAAISVVEIAIIAMMGQLVDWLSGAERAGFLDDNLWQLVGIGALFIIGYPLLVFVQSLVTHQTIFGNYPMIARWLAHRYILGQSMSFFQDEFAGRVSQKVMQTALAIRETVMKLTDVMVFMVVYFIGAVVLVGAADPRLTLPLVLWLVGYIAIARHFVPQLRLISMQQADARAQMTGRIVDSYTNIQTIKLFAHTRREQDYARDAMDGFMVTVHRQMRLVTKLTVALQTMNALLLAGTAGLAIYGWYVGTISLGAIAVAIALVTRIRAMSEWVLWEIAGLFENIGTVQDGMNTIALPQTVNDTPDAQPLEVSRGAVAFDRVAFHYGRTGGVIGDLSLHVRPGERIGIIGRSGAGKSTLVNLLLRFHDIEAGKISIDGQDIAGVTQESLRRAIAVVTQDTALLHRSIRDNVAYGRPEASDAEVIAALERAQAWDFVRDITDAQGRTGLNAHAGERGVKLSGGQRQRIAIARALLKNAPILVLDEATSALDSEVEAAIQEQLSGLMAGKTVFAIAHRLSTIAALDRLVVMDEGRIVEEGTHDALLQQGGLYADLWHRQSGGFLSTGPETAAIA
ncbi:MAG: ABC transporter ATP-binding protein [Pararhodobacter sp.]|nr:ABC transporter ATP-binding protein [Pararhodobacter sp.]